METLAFILSISGLIMGVSASLIKGKKMGLILLCVLLSNFLMATSYLVGGGGINGAISCYIGCLQAGINFFFQRKNKDIPKWLIGVYALMFITANLLGEISWFSALSILACLTFIGGIAQKNGKSYRTWHAVNSSLWCTYDIVTKSYEPLVSHLILLTFGVVGIIIHDRKQKQA